MILPEIWLANRSNERCQQQGLDSIEKALDPEWFLNFPYAIDYCYNSRGFRDEEWPDSLNDLQQAAWCVGDSFTVGIGSPYEHIWPRVLQKAMHRRTINVSMDGASNNWIARKTVKILQVIQPQVLIVHWSYLHRREGLTELDKNNKYGFLLHYDQVKDPSWPPISQVEQFSSLPAHVQNELMTQHGDHWRQNISDEQLRLWHIRSDIEDDIENTRQCIELVDQHRGQTRLIHSFIPGFVSGYQQEFYQCLDTPNSIVPEFAPLDLARDRHHYDIKTSEYFVQKILQELN